MNRFKKIMKYVAIILAAITTLIFGFFFWASSSNLEEADYSIITIASSDFETNSDDSVISIMTYNIGYLSGLHNNTDKCGKTDFDNNLGLVKSQINNIKPDIIAFQELDYDATRSFEIDQEKEMQGLGYGYAARTVNWDKKYVPFPYWPPSIHFGKVISGQSVLSKYPIESQERIVLERVPGEPFWRDGLYLDRLAQVVKLNIKGKDVVLINVHLEAWDKPTRLKQQKTVITLYEKYAKDYPTILLGDFNSDPASQDATINKMFNVEGIECATLNLSDYEFTFPSNEPKERLDYIFYSGNTIKYKSGKVLKEFKSSSDHLPLYMRFELK